MRKKMPNKSARYYMGKVLTVLDWIKAGKSAELQECGKIDGRCAEIVRAQVEVINEVKRILSEPETLNVYFAMATKRESPIEKVPNLFNQLDREDSIPSPSCEEIVENLRALRDNLDRQFHQGCEEEYNTMLSALNKAIRFMQITDRFLSKK
jgi:hypothetical protein